MMIGMMILKNRKLNFIQILYKIFHIFNFLFKKKIIIYIFYHIFL